MANIVEVNLVLTVCQVSPAKRNALVVREHLNLLGNYAELTNRDIMDLATKFECWTVANGRVIMPAKVLKNLQALCFWTKEQIWKGVVLDGNEFSAVELAATKEAMRIREEGVT